MKRTTTEAGPAARAGLELRYRLKTEARSSGLGGAAVHPERQSAPRIARLLALAIRCEQLRRRGEAGDQATLARLGRISRSRMTQIMNLQLLAPDIQEEILFLPQSARITEKHLRTLSGMVDWHEQRRHWHALRDNAPHSIPPAPAPREPSTSSPVFSGAKAIETKYLHLREPAELGADIGGWRVCWLGGWDKCKVFFVVMVLRNVTGT